MRSWFKRFGAVGAAVLVLNEIRGVMVVAAVLNGWAESAQAHPHTETLAKLVACLGGGAC